MSVSSNLWFQLLSAVSLLIGLVAGLDAAQADARPPASAFDGCGMERADVPFANEADKPPAPTQRRIDPITQREFMSFSIDEVEGFSGVSQLECWARLDGVWQEDSTISLDHGFHPTGWASASPEQLSLAHGVYTQPGLLVIEPTTTPDTTLTVHYLYSGGPPTKYVSSDGVPLSSVLRRSGRTKVYLAADSLLEHDYRTLKVDVSRTGYVRLQFGDHVYVRPRPGTQKSEWKQQISDRDPFMIGFTMENMIASRRGYDVTTQNPNRFLSNSKAEVFAHKRQGYSIDEKRIVPLGLRLLKEDTQGMVHYSSNVTSESDFQRLTSSSYGKTRKIGASGSVGLTIPPFVQASRNIEYSHSWGSEHARTQIQSMKHNNFVAREIGVMRFKRYALVQDLPYSELSDRFVDAVDDAYRSKNYAAVIEKFGTHYPYAMTYGAAGQVSHNITADGFVRAFYNSAKSTKTNETVLDYYSQNSFQTSETETGSSFSERSEYGEKAFDAVGGNGSWSETGFAAGEANYPILADLRPLHELLTPINFPGEPEIYDAARIELADAIDQYLWDHAELSKISLLDDIDLSNPEISGCWLIEDGLGNRNMIQKAGQHAIVVWRHGKEHTRYDYVAVSPNGYRHKHKVATYEFFPGGKAVWHSKDQRNIVLELTRIGAGC